MVCLIVNRMLRVRVKPFGLELKDRLVGVNRVTKVTKG
jgi:hypothetical protein